MKTKDLAKQIVQDLGIESESAFEEVYRRILVFLADDYSNDDMRLDGPRYKAMKYAHSHGFFWLPCILCGTWTGGQETDGIPVGVMLTGNYSVGTCNSPDCQAEAKRLKELHAAGIRQALAR